MGARPFESTLIMAGNRSLPVIKLKKAARRGQAQRQKRPPTPYPLPQPEESPSSVSENSSSPPANDSASQLRKVSHQIFQLSRGMMDHIDRPIRSPSSQIEKVKHQSGRIFNSMKQLIEIFHEELERARQPAAMLRTDGRVGKVAPHGIDDDTRRVADPASPCLVEDAGSSQ